MNTERPIEYRCKDSWGIPVVGAEWADAKIAKLKAVNAELARLCEKALSRSAIVHPGFADEIRAALSRAQEE